MIKITEFQYFSKKIGIILMPRIIRIVNHVNNSDNLIRQQKYPSRAKIACFCCRADHAKCQAGTANLISKKVSGKITCLRCHQLKRPCIWAKKIIIIAKDRTPLDWSTRKIKQISHQLEIGGSVPILFDGKFNTITLEGSNQRNWLRKMAKSLHTFQKLTLSHREVIFQMLTQASNHKHRTSPRMFWESFSNGVPILIPTGFNLHAVTILFSPKTEEHPPYLFLCNRGKGHAQNPTTVFSFDESRFNEKIISEILTQRKKEEETYHSFIKNLFLELKVDKTMKAMTMENFCAQLLPLQTVGNCSWASAEGAILAAILILEIHERESLSPELFTKVQNNFTSWKQSIAFDTLESYLDGYIEKNLYETISFAHSVYTSAMSSLSKVEEFQARFNLLQGRYQAISIAKGISPQIESHE